MSKIFTEIVEMIKKIQDDPIFDNFVREEIINLSALLGSELWYAEDEVSPAFYEALKMLGELEGALRQYAFNDATRTHDATALLLTESGFPTTWVEKMDPLGPWYEFTTVTLRCKLQYY